MNFEWSSNDIAKLLITIYPNNITLNKSASKYFDNVGYVLLGIDKDAMKLGIKPVYKEDLDHQIYPKDHLHRISMGSSYARISSKSFINDLSNLIDLDFTNQPSYKIEAEFDVIHSIMIGNLKEV